LDESALIQDAQALPGVQQNVVIGCPKGKSEWLVD